MMDQSSDYDYEWQDKDTDEINSIASEELHETRPNRWSGPPTTWRRYTRPERNTFQSLETTRSQDLSIHLYNSFALSKRAKDKVRMRSISYPLGTSTTNMLTRKFRRGRHRGLTLARRMPGHRADFGRHGLCRQMRSQMAAACRR